VLPDEVQPVDDHSVLAGHHALHAPALPFVFARDNLDGVACANFIRTGRSILRIIGVPPLQDFWGERDDAHELFVAQFAGDGSEDARAARLALVVDDDAGVSSKRSVLPSGRRMALRVRTITARTTSPFLMGMFGVAALTDATITSPTCP
jgi:hypothetical protein